MSLYSGNWPCGEASSTRKSLSWLGGYSDVPRSLPGGQCSGESAQWQRVRSKLQCLCLALAGATICSLELSRAIIFFLLLTVSNECLIRIPYYVAFTITIDRFVSSWNNLKNVLVCKQKHQLIHSNTNLKVYKIINCFRLFEIRERELMLMRKESWNNLKAAPLSTEVGN